MDEFTQQLLEVFHGEAAEALDEFAQLLSSLDTDDAAKRREAMATAFRIAHNVKGSAAMVEAAAVETLAHAMEDALSPYRKSGDKPPPGLPQALLEAIAVTEAALENRCEEERMNRVLQLLRSFGGANAATAPATSKVEASAVSKADASVTTKVEASEPRTADASTKAPAVSGAAAAAAPSKPSVPTPRGAATPSPSTPEALRAGAGGSAGAAGNGSPAPTSGAGGSTTAQTPLASAGSAAAARAAAPEEPPSDAADDSGHGTSRAESGVKVDGERLDQLMGYVGELLGFRGRLQLQTRKLVQLEESYRAAIDSAQGELHDLLKSLATDLESTVGLTSKDVQQLGYVVDDMNAATKRIRMLPLRNLLPVWRKIVREAAAATDKPVHLATDVGDVELDKHLYDRLYDPFLHLLRNAVDHGIEPSADRRAAGKPEVGSIRIGARVEGGMIEIEVTDDGRGLDAAAIADRAIKMGLITADRLRTMSESEKVELIFASGLSTATTVSRLSGRGVGLDIVRQRLRELGGDVIAHPRSNCAGASFTMTIPTSLLSIRSLLVNSGDAACALPIDYVARTVRVSASRCELLNGRLVCRPEGETPIALVHLGTVLGAPVTIGSGYLTVVILRYRDAELGLAVQEIIDEHDFVTRPLPWNLRGTRGVSGATILPDGRIALVLDVARLFASPLASGRLPSTHSSKGERQRKVRILVVDDSLTARTLAQNTLTSAGYEVTMAVDGAQAWQLLAEQSFDLVVADVQMPELDGFELTRRIRATPATAHLPVVLCTTLKSKEDMLTGATAGADEYVVKGQFDQQQLLEAVARLS